MLKLIRDQLITRLDHTYRFNGTPIIPPAESVSQHSYWVTMYSNLLFRDIFFLSFKCCDTPLSLYFEMYNFLIRQALCHDTGEQITGDVLWNIKYHPEYGSTIRAALDNIVHKEVREMNGVDVFTLEWQSVLWQDRLPDERHTVLNHITDLSVKEKIVCLGIKKVADWLSMYHFSYSQYSLGNKLMVEKCEVSIIEMRKVIIGLATALEDSGLPYSRSALENIVN